MPDKSKQQTKTKERRRTFLGVRVFRATLIGAGILGITALLLGTGLYTNAMMQQYISESFSLAKGAASLLQLEGNIIPLSREVMGIYRSMSEEERLQTGTTEYRDRSETYWGSREEYIHANVILGAFADSSNEISELYLAMYDEETASIVYIVDTDSDPLTHNNPGEWDPVSRKGMAHFLNWNGEGSLYLIENTEEFGWICTSGFPIWDQGGTIAAFVFCDISMSFFMARLSLFLIPFILAIVVLTPLIGYFISRYMRKTVVRPVNAIADAARQYVADKRSNAGVTDHFAVLDIHTGDEVENLSLVMADMEKELSEIEKDLTAISSEKERISTELSLAARIQTSMLPHVFPPFPERNEFDLYASMDPAREVGGDFYDYFLIDDDHLGLVIADVSGKGIPASLFMMASMIILHSIAVLGTSPAETLARTNQVLCSGNQEDMFVTVWIGILEISTGKLTAANAGHEYPVLYRPKDGYTLYKDRHGFVLGGMPESRYREYELHLNPGDRLFLYTDGVPEAANPEDELFGTDRLLDSLNTNHSSGTETILTDVRKAIDEFVRDAEQFDDMTMLCVEYFGPQE